MLCISVHHCYRRLQYRDTISSQHNIKTGNMKHNNTMRLNTGVFKLQIGFEYNFPYAVSL